MVRLTQERTRWFAEHVLPHEPALRAWLSRKLLSRLDLPFDVDDVVQESYAALASMNEVGRIRHPRAYLFRVAQSVILQHLRRAQIVSIEAVAEVDRLEVSHNELSPERHTMAHQELHRMGMLIATLPNKCRQAFVLRKIHGLSQREIAQRMRISESTVEKHIAKGVRLLADALGSNSYASSSGAVEAIDNGNENGKASR